MNRWMQRTAFLAVCFLFWGLRVEAFSQDVVLQTEGNEVRITMGALGEEAVSMQMSLEVKVTKGDADAKISFEFDPGLSGSVKQYRYDQASGVLNVYVSGDSGHRLSGEEYNLGKVVLNAGAGEAEATVEVKPDSLKIVNDAYDLQRVGQVNAAPMQTVTAGEKQTETPVSPPDGEGSHSGSSDKNADSSGSGNGNAASPAGSPSPVSADRVKNRRDVGIRANVSSNAVEGESESPPPDLQEEGAQGLDSEGNRSDLEEERGDSPSAGNRKKGIKNIGSEDLLLLAGLAAAGLGAVIVILLMVQESNRRKRARARREQRRRSRKVSSAKKKKKRKTKRDQP